MLYSILVSIAAYYGILFFVGVLVNAAAIEGTLLTLAVICYMGAYFTRTYSRFVFRLATGVGMAATTLVVAIWLLLPHLAGSGKVWVTIIAVFAGLAIYLLTRRSIFRHYRRMSAPPFGREWCRWLFIVLM